MGITALCHSMCRLFMPALAACSMFGTNANAGERSATVDMFANDMREEHGTLSVSGLRTPPGRIELPYVHYRSGNGPRPTIFFLGGGPGLSNLKWVPPESWLLDFDVVVLEYRGVGESSIVLHSDHFRRGLGRPAASLALAHATQMRDEFAAGFADLRRQGVDFTEFSVSSLADDIEHLRKTLGLERIHLVAHSFGTRVALLYQTRYRKRTAGSVLFSLNTPGGFIWYPDDTKNVWRRYRDTLAHTDRKLYGTVDALLQAADGNYAQGQRCTRYGIFGIDDARALTVAFFLSFNASTRDHALRAMQAAANGNAGSWYLMSLSYKLFVRFGFNWADFFLKAYNSDCDRQAIERADKQGHSSPFQSPSSLLFSASDAFEAAGGRCAADDFVPDYRDTLAIVGEFDPSTPLERKPADLPDERYVVIRNAGHADVLYDDPGGAAHWLRHFFLHPDTGTLSMNHR